MAYGADGFAYAAESIVGRYIGAKQRKEAKRVTVLTTSWGLHLALCFTLIYWMFDREIITLFTDKVSHIELAMLYMTWTIAAPLVNAFCFIWDGVFLGATQTAEMRNSMPISTLLVFFPAFYLTVNYIGNHALWLAMTLYMITRGITLAVYLPGLFRKIEI